MDSVNQSGKCEDVRIGYPIECCSHMDEETYEGGPNQCGFSKLPSTDLDADPIILRKMEVNKLIEAWWQKHLVSKTREECLALQDPESLELWAEADALIDQFYASENSKQNKHREKLYQLLTGNPCQEQVLS